MAWMGDGLPTIACDGRANARRSQRVCWHVQLMRRHVAGVEAAGARGAARHGGARRSSRHCRDAGQYEQEHGDAERSEHDREYPRGSLSGRGKLRRDVMRNVRATLA